MEERVVVLHTLDTCLWIKCRCFFFNFIYYALTSEDVGPVVQSAAAAASALDSCGRRRDSGSGCFHMPVGGFQTSGYGILSENSLDWRLIKARFFIIKKVTLKPRIWLPARRERRPRNLTSSTRPSCPKCWGRKTTSTAPTARRKVRLSPTPPFYRFRVISWYLGSELTVTTGNNVPSASFIQSELVSWLRSST